MEQRIQALLHRYKEGLTALYGARLQHVYLYGSHARGDFDSESDVDVLIVLDAIGRYGAEIECTSELTSDLSLETGLSISRVFISRHDWLHRELPFLDRVRAEGIAA